MLKPPTDSPPPECGTNAFVCSFEIEAIDTTAQVIAEYGGQAALPKFAIPEVCWQGYFVEPKVQNGMSFCILHDRALDRQFIGVTPDYQIE